MFRVFFHWYQENILDKSGYFYIIGSRECGSRIEFNQQTIKLIKDKLKTLVAKNNNYFEQPTFTKINIDLQTRKPAKAPEGSA